MPINQFWSASKNIVRIDAETRMSDLRVLNSAGSKEATEALMSELIASRGTTLVLENTAPDEGAFEKLGALAGAG